MEINKKSEYGKLIVELEGRLDTNTAPDLEKELSNLDSSENVILDFQKLDYLSSAGLRIILMLQKKLSSSGSLTIKNVNDTIKNIFDITGFSDILTIY